MQFYAHYSFDLWLTLIKSNPFFKRERVLFFFKYLNPRQKTIEDITEIFRHVDLMCNHINQKTGGNIASTEMYLMVISMMNDYDNTFEDIDIVWVEKEMEKLFFSYMPNIYDKETKNTLQQIKQSGNSSLNILSNTGFIKGTTLRKLLSIMEISDLFDFQLYSDEAGMSKPNSHFFQLMLNEVYLLKKDRDINLDRIIHVGDNIIADIHGAQAVGINSFHIHTNNQSILSLIH